MEIMADFSCYPIRIPRKWGKKNRKKRVPQRREIVKCFPRHKLRPLAQITMITEQYGHELATTRHQNQPRNPFLLNF